MCTGGGVRSKLNVYYTTIPESDVANVVFGYVNTIILRHVLLTIQQFSRIGKVFSSQVQRQQSPSVIFGPSAPARYFWMNFNTVRTHNIIIVVCAKTTIYTRILHDLPGRRTSAAACPRTKLFDTTSEIHCCSRARIV